MKKTTHRLLAFMLALVMVLGMTPMATFSVNYHENENQQESGVFLSKSAMLHRDQGGNPDGTVDIRIDAYTTGDVHLVNSNTVPTDILLLLDLSGSMGDSIQDTTISYEAVNGTKEFNGFLFFGDYYYGMHDDSEYFVKIGNEYLPLYDDDYDDNNFSLYHYVQNGQSVYVYPKASGSYDSQPQYTQYPFVQFYKLSEVASTQTKEALLKTAVQRFIQQIAMSNEGIENADDKHRIAIVKYASDSYYNSSTRKSVSDISKPVLVPGDNRNNSGYNYTQVLKDFTTVDATSANTLISAMNATRSGGATAIDYGLTLSEALFKSRTDADDRNSVLVVLTDGEPNHSSGFDKSVAATAINKAADIKQAEIPVFSIGMFTGANEAQLGTGANQFMQYVSSNYPNIRATYRNSNLSYTNTTGSPTGGYYMARSSDHSLIGIFENIVEEIGAPTTTLDSASTVVDVVTPIFIFTDTTNPINSITLQTADRIYNEASGFSFADPVAATGATASVENNVVSVTGFDYDSNCLTTTPRNGTFYGRKLIITINVEPDYEELDKLPLPASNSFETNTSLTLFDGEDNVVATTASPDIAMNRVSYQIEGETGLYAEYLRLPGAKVKVKDVPAKTGYDFDGWNPDNSPTVAPVTVDSNNEFVMPERDVTFTGAWENGDVNYRVEYYFQNLENDNYTLNSTHSSTRTGETNSTVTASQLAANLTVGFTFNATKSIMAGTVAADGSTVLKVFYDRNSYSVTYAYAAGTPAGAPALPSGLTNVKYGAEVTVASAPTLQGYDFQGWAVTSPAGVTIANGKFTMPANDVVVTGAFNAGNSKYAVEYYFQNIENDNYTLNSAYSLTNQTALTGSTATAAPLTAGQTVGFTLNTTKSSMTAVVAADGSTVLKVFYDRNSYSVTYQYVAGTPAGAPTLPSGLTNIKYGAEITVASAPTFQGYDFQGWAVTSPVGVTISEGKFTMPANDVIVTGSFNAGDAKYTLEHYFEQEDGSYLIDNTLTSEVTSITGTSITITSSDVPVVPDYEFSESNPNNVLSGTVLADGSLVLKAYYQLKEKTIIIPFTKIVEGDAEGENTFKFDVAPYSLNAPMTDCTVSGNEITVTGTGSAVGRISITGPAAVIEALKVGGIKISESQLNKGEGWTYSDKTFVVIWEAAAEPEHEDATGGDSVPVPASVPTAPAIVMNVHEVVAGVLNSEVIPNVEFKNSFKKTLQLITEVEGGVGGTITAGKTGIDEGEIETVIFTPEEGFEIESVTVNGQEIEVTSNSLELEMTEDMIVIVSYKTSNPETDDSGNMFMWIAVMMLSCAGIVTTALFGKKKEYNR